MNIDGSVGRNGANDRRDTRLVQHLLNDAGAGLTVDGLVGPKTIGAIEQFQQRSGIGADGRVDPGGATLRALVAAFWSTLNAGITVPEVIAENLSPPDDAVLRAAFDDLLLGLKA
jgi:peptidoglycan hydrolase-like protein with peptidoglycan-binding domain